MVDGPVTAGHREGAAIQIIDQAPHEAHGATLTGHSEPGTHQTLRPHLGVGHRDQRMQRRAQDVRIQGIEAGGPGEVHHHRRRDRTDAGSHLAYGRIGGGQHQQVDAMCRCCGVVIPAEQPD